MSEENVSINVNQSSIVPSLVDTNDTTNVSVEAEIPVNVMIETNEADVSTQIINSGIVNLSIEGGTTVENDYNALINKPKINDVTLIGNKSFPDLHLNSLTYLELLEILT